MSSMVSLRLLQRPVWPEWVLEKSVFHEFLTYQSQKVAQAMLDAEEWPKNPGAFEQTPWSEVPKNVAYLLGLLWEEMWELVDQFAREQGIMPRTPETLRRWLLTTAPQLVTDRGRAVWEWYYRELAISEAVYDLKDPSLRAAARRSLQKWFN